jgi:hypothetical protein
MAVPGCPYYGSSTRLKRDSVNFSSANPPGGGDAPCEFKSGAGGRSRRSTSLDCHTCLLGLVVKQSGNNSTTVGWSERGVRGGPLAFESVNLVSHIACWQSLAVLGHLINSGWNGPSLPLA